MSEELSHHISSGAKTPTPPVLLNSYANALNSSHSYPMSKEGWCYRVCTNVLARDLKRARDAVNATNGGMEAEAKLSGANNRLKSLRRDERDDVLRLIDEGEII